MVANVGLTEEAEGFILEIEKILLKRNIPDVNRTKIVETALRLYAEELRK